MNAKAFLRNSTRYVGHALTTFDPNACPDVEQLYYTRFRCKRLQSVTAERFSYLVAELFKALDVVLGQRQSRDLLQQGIALFFQRFDGALEPHFPIS